MTKESELFEKRVRVLVNLLRVPDEQARAFIFWADADELPPQMGATGPHQDGWKAWAILKLVDALTKAQEDVAVLEDSLNKKLAPLQQDVAALKVAMNKVTQVIKWPEDKKDSRES